MPIFQAYESAMERDFDILFRQYDIDMMRAKTQLTLESTGLFTEAEEVPVEGAKPGKATSFIGKTIQFIMNLITGVIEMIENIFSKKEHMTTGDYVNSNTGKIQLEYDLAEADKRAADEVRKGRKLVQLISRGTGVNDAEVEKYVDGASRFTLKHKGVIMVLGAAALSLHTYHNRMKKLKTEVASTGKEAETVTDPKKQKQISRVISAMGNAVRGFTKGVSFLATQMNKES